jgi:uncharacterized protein
MDDFTFSDNAGRHRFELHKDGKLAAHADYRMEDGAVKLIHTEVLPGLEGQGVGSKMAKATLEEIRKRGAKIVPVCEFMAGYIGKHAEYADLVVSA